MRLAVREKHLHFAFATQGLEFMSDHECTFTSKGNHMGSLVSKAVHKHAHHVRHEQIRDTEAQPETLLIDFESKQSLLPAREPLIHLPTQRPDWSVGSELSPFASPTEKEIKKARKHRKLIALGDALTNPVGAAVALTLTATVVASRSVIKAHDKKVARAAAVQAAAQLAARHEIAILER